MSVQQLPLLASDVRPQPNVRLRADGSLAFPQVSSREKLYSRIQFQHTNSFILEYILEYSPNSTVHEKQNRLLGTRASVSALFERN